MKLQFSDEHMGFINTAIAERDAILAKDPQNIEARYNKALMLLSVGQFSEGWPLFDVRCELPDAIHKYDWFPVPRWDGSDITGKHVLLWLEQGIGDQIMAMAMVQRLADKAATVTMLADRRFRDICKRTFSSNVQFHMVGEHITPRLAKWDFDCQLSVTDLGRMFLRTGDDFNSKPYLKANPEKIAELRRKYKTDERPLIGFSWMSTNARFGNLKSIPPDQMRKLLSFKEFNYVNLQYGDNDSDEAALRALGCEFITDSSIDPLISLDDSAAQIAAMDMIVSVSNSTVHFAGALGVETIALVPLGHGRVWYWFTEHDNTPWYDSVKICRANKPGDWSDAIGNAFTRLFAKSFEQDTGRQHAYVPFHN